MLVRTRPHGAKEKRVKLPLQCRFAPAEIDLDRSKILTKQRSVTRVRRWGLLDIVGEMPSLAYDLSGVGCP